MISRSPPAFASEKQHEWRSALLLRLRVPWVQLWQSLHGVVQFLDHTHVRPTLLLCDNVSQH